jgi:hypothetical protein
MLVVSYAERRVRMPLGVVFETDSFMEGESEQEGAVH